MRTAQASWRNSMSFEGDRACLRNAGRCQVGDASREFAQALREAPRPLLGGEEAHSLDLLDKMKRLRAFMLGHVRPGQLFEHFEGWSGSAQFQLSSSAT